MVAKVGTVGCPLINGDEVLATTAVVFSNMSSPGGRGGASNGSGGGGGGAEDSTGGSGGRSSVPTSRNKNKQIIIYCGYVRSSPGECFFINNYSYQQAATVHKNGDGIATSYELGWSSWELTKTSADREGWETILDGPKLPAGRDEDNYLLSN